MRIYDYYPPFTISAENQSTVEEEIQARKQSIQKKHLASLRRFWIYALLYITIGATLLTMLHMSFFGWLILGFFALVASFLWGAIPPRFPDEYIIRTKKCPLCGSFYFGRTIPFRRGEDGTRYYGIRERYCPRCQCVTVDDPYIPDNDNPPVSVKPNHVNWVKCPHCQKHFSLEFRASWNGERHTTCGQYLTITSPEGDILSKWHGDIYATGSHEENGNACMAIGRSGQNGNISLPLCSTSDASGSTV
jgi:hypothetical protein